MEKLLPLVPDATHCVEMSTNSPTFRLIVLRLSSFPSGLKCCQKLFSLGPVDQLHQVLIQSSTVQEYKTMSSVTLAASCHPGCPNKKWLGFKTVSSRWSAPPYVNGLKFIKASTLIEVCTPSLVGPAFPTVASRIFLATWISDSETPQWTQFYLILLLAAFSAFRSRLIAWTSSLISLSLPLSKFVHYGLWLLPVFHW